MSRLVLAYSGGLDTSVLLKKLILSGVEVVAMTIDLGESDMQAGSGAAAELEKVAQKARDLGAYEAVVIDARERFVADYALPALAANAMYEGVYPLSAALSRPLIGALLVETAHRFGADAVAHGCTGKGNDQVRIELAVRAIDPSITVRAPLRESPLSRPDAMLFAAEHGIPISHTTVKPYSIDANLWGRSIEAGVLEDPWTAPPEDAYAWTAGPQARPLAGDEIVVHFEGGVPTLRQAQGDTVSGAAMVAWLNAIAGKHGIGRIDLVEDRVIGVKSREVYEAPAATVLIAAHKALERLTLTRDELRFKASADQKYAELAYDGLWMSPLRDALDAFNASFATRMSGDVRVVLHQGSVVVAGVRSPYALYDEALATYGAGDAFDHQAAGGFIRCYGLPLDRVAQVMRLDALAVTP
ncbi:MAG TPA: argininosuccinate synthase [Candidatus Baltobacteraceae bacterium]|nr:argininosuccinate synthase [Candidatus Baltobacteraceae bacterium]